jgi:hypothetical protein
MKFATQDSPLLNYIIITHMPVLQSIIKYTLLFCFYYSSSGYMLYSLLKDEVGLNLRVVIDDFLIVVLLGGVVLRG